MAPSDNDLENILAALIDAQPGDVIFLTAGTYHVNGQLSLDVDDVTLRGEGMDKSIISYLGQTTGAEGLLVTANRFTIEDIGLENSRGDLLKVLGGNGLTIRRVRTEWTNGPATTNGSYGLYPVQCQNVLIEDSVVRGASDAGVYVGQSHNIIVRRNTVQFNVAGIEIENSTDADVYENAASHNTGGILVFNLPGLQVNDGRRTRIFHNEIFENDTPNFAPEGNTVAAVQTGTGFMVLANDQVEVFENNFSNNGFSHVVVIGFQTATILGGFVSNDPTFDPYSEGIHVHDNVYVGGGDRDVPGTARLVARLVGGFPLPNIIYDGDENPDELEDGELPPELRNCFEDDATFADLDVDHNFTTVSLDISAFDCAYDPLPAIVIPGVDEGGPTPSVPPPFTPPAVTPTPPAGNVETRCGVPEGTATSIPANRRASSSRAIASSSAMDRRQSRTTAWCRTT